jgi:two-component sensor histidine kinase
MNKYDFSSSITSKVNVTRLCEEIYLTLRTQARAVLRDSLVIKLILLSAAFLLNISSLAAQQSQTSKQTLSAQEVIKRYSTAQKRLLAINTAIFINEITQSHLDADSVQMVASRITGMPFLLPYTARIEGDQPSAIAILIYNNRIEAARKLSKQLKGEEQIRSLVNLASWYLHQPKAFRRDLDSAEHYITEANSLSLTMHIKKWQDESILIMGEIQHQRGNIDQARHFYSYIISPAKRGTETEIVASALLELNRTFATQDSTRLQYLNRSISIYHRLHQVENEIVLRWLIGDYYLTNNRALAEDNFRQVLPLERSSGFRHELFCLNLLTRVSTDNSNLSDALKFGYAGVENMVWSRLTQFRGEFYMRIGVIYSAVGKLSLALPWFRKGVEIKSDDTHFFWYKSFLYLTAALYQLDKSKESLSVIDSTVSKYPPKSLWENVEVLSTIGECYEQMHMHSLADITYRKVLETVKNYEDTYGELSETFVDCALFYVRLKNAALARSFLNKVNPNSLPLEYYNSQKYNIQYKIDSLNGDFKTAFRDLLLFHQANNAVMAYDQQQTLNELTVRYAAAKKDQDIKLLREQERAQKSELQKGKLTRNLMIAAGALLVLLLAVVISRYQLKQRTNKQIARKSESLQHLLTEKEWLLKEVHHRVKNNLHSVISLLEAQASYLENDALQAIENSQHRIYAMSLIHQKLYQSEDIKTINMVQYIPELVQYLRDSFDTGHIHFNITVHPIHLNASQAIPLGLIINEALTNSIKYAFPNGRRGEISVSLTDANGKYKLELADNGIGIPEGKANVKNNSLGLELMKGLVKELGGNIIFENANGVKITIIFETGLLHYSNRLQDDHLAQA